MKKFIAAVLFIGMIQNANAAFIDSGTYLTDTSSGLDWLDVTATSSLSYSYVSGQLGSGGLYEGWHYATSADFNELVSNWIGATTPITSLGKVIQAEGDIDGLHMALGDLYPSYSDYGYTQGLIADMDSSGNVRTAMIMNDDNSNINNDDLDWTQANYHLYTQTAAGWYFGSFLIRDTAASVPEPGALGLVTLSLAGIGFAVRRRKKTVLAS